jgi:hypothetical protein
MQRGPKRERAKRKSRRRRTVGVRRGQTPRCGTTSPCAEELQRSTRPARGGEQRPGLGNGWFPAPEKAALGRGTPNETTLPT